MVGSAKYPGITGLPAPGVLKAACAKAEMAPIKKKVIKRMVLFFNCIYNHRTTKTNQKYPSVNL